MSKLSNGAALAMAQKRKVSDQGGVGAVVPTNAGVAKLQERALLVRLATGRWYGQGTDETVTEDVRTRAGAKGDVGTFTKRLMERQHLAAINQVVNDARRYHKGMTAAWADQFKILNAEFFLDYKATMTDYKMKFDKEVRAFLQQWDELVAAEKRRLKGLAKDGDYPSQATLKERFYMEVRYEAIPDADDFRAKLSGEDIEMVRQQMREELAESFREMTVDLWGRLFKLVQKMRDVLASSDAGVRAALFQNLKDVVALMPKLNVAGDKKLEAMTTRITKELLAEDVEAVKDDDALRSQVAAKATSILDAMSSFLGSDAPQQQAKEKE
jgi:hypothetical protein